MNACDMVPELTLALSKWKLVAASGVASLAMLADVALPVDRVEDLTLKGVLLMAVIYLVRELAKQRDSDKVECKLREEKLNTVITSNTSALQDNSAKLHEQTEYLRTVANKIIERDLNGPARQHGTHAAP